jgi:hypothetical protein
MCPNPPLSLVSRAYHEKECGKELCQIHHEVLDAHVRKTALLESTRRESE